MLRRADRPPRDMVFDRAVGVLYVSYADGDGVEFVGGAFDPTAETVHAYTLHTVEEAASFNVFGITTHTFQNSNAACSLVLPPIRRPRRRYLGESALPGW